MFGGLCCLEQNIFLVLPCGVIFMEQNEPQLALIALKFGRLVFYMRAKWHHLWQTSSKIRWVIIWKTEKANSALQLKILHSGLRAL